MEFVQAIFCFCAWGRAQQLASMQCEAPVQRWLLPESQLAASGGLAVGGFLAQQTDWLEWLLRERKRAVDDESCDYTAHPLSLVHGPPVLCTPLYSM